MVLAPSDTCREARHRWDYTQFRARRNSSPLAYVVRPQLQQQPKRERESLPRTITQAQGRLWACQPMMRANRTMTIAPSVAVAIR